MGFMIKTIEFGEGFTTFSDFFYYYCFANL